MASPSGYGPLRAWPLMKWVRAVGMAVERPGKASSADGISSFLRNENMRRLLIGEANICVTRPRRTGRRDHDSDPSPLVGEGRVGGREGVRERRRARVTSRPPPLPL